MSEEQRQAIAYNKLSVEGYNLAKINELHIVEAINQHTKLRLTGILQEQEDDDEIHNTTGRKNITVYYEEDQQRKVLFSGVVVSIEVENSNDVNIVEIIAYDATYLMDIEVKSRSFQDTSMTISQLIREVMKDYEPSDWMMFIKDRPIGELVVQYEETDWEFIKRFVGKYYSGLFVDCKFKSIHYVINVPQQEVKLKYKLSDYIVIKDIKTYEYMKENYLKDAQEIDFITYEVERYEIFFVGQYIKINGRPFYIYHSTHEIKNGLLVNTYKLCIKNGLRQKNLFNTKIIGCAIGGKIIDVQRDLVRIHLDIDKTQDKSKAYWFIYSTMSASSDGSGWYCMPELGDTVRVYFPTKEEKDAFAISAVSDYVQGAAETEDRMGNPDNKYLRTPYDKQVKLTPDGIFISCNSGQAEANLKSDGTLTITSMNNLDVHATENITIEVLKQFKVSAKESILFQCDKGGGLDFDKEGQIREMGTQVNNN